MWEKLITQSGSLNIFISRNFAGSGKSDFITDMRASIWKTAAIPWSWGHGCPQDWGRRRHKRIQWGSLTASLVEKPSSKLSKIFCSQDLRERTAEKKDTWCPLSSLKHTPTYNMHSYIHTHICTHTKNLIFLEYEIKMVNNVGFFS